MDDMEKSQDFLDLQKQLDFLRENRRMMQEDRENYYDSEQDLTDIRQYYETAGGPDWDWGDTPLFSTLHELLDITHKNRIPYNTSKDLYLYAWVDLHPDGSLKSIYSGEEKDPESVILEDLTLVRQKYAEFQSYIQSEQPTIAGLNEFEWRIKFNAEHVVPQSWFGASEPMKGDLHHLFTCDPKCNSSRSNYHYSDFPDYNPDLPDEPIQNDCGVAADRLFEPEHGKGTSARAMMYFFLRYPKAVKNEFQAKIDIPLLIKWHEEYPATLYEKHRNQAIYNIQGNRNPFIDFPQLVDKLVFPMVERVPPIAP
ncbi:endonuclease I family protein [Mesobacillus zeae]|nr:endonuclease [Mesobacillus zeae]